MPLSIQMSWSATDLNRSRFRRGPATSTRDAWPPICPSAPDLPSQAVLGTPVALKQSAQVTGIDGATISGRVLRVVQPLASSDQPVAGHHDVGVEVRLTEGDTSMSAG